MHVTMQASQWTHLSNISPVPQARLLEQEKSQGRGRGALVTHAPHGGAKHDHEASPGVTEQAGEKDYPWNEGEKKELQAKK